MILRTKKSEFNTKIIPDLAKFDNYIFKVIIMNEEYIIKNVRLVYDSKTKIIKEIRILKGLHLNSDENGILSLSTCKKLIYNDNIKNRLDYLIGWYDLNRIITFPKRNEIILIPLESNKNRNLIKVHENIKLLIDK